MEFDVAIVGGGPCGTYALDRLYAALKRTQPIRPLKIVIFEKTGKFGCGGVHDYEQPITSYMNRASADIAMGAGKGDSFSGVLGPGVPPFLDWVRDRHIDAFGRAAHEPLQGAETPSRALHGAALTSAFEAYVKRLEKHRLGKVTLLDKEVIDIRRFGLEFQIAFDAAGNQESVITRHILLVTGHTQTSTPRDDFQLEQAAHGNPRLNYVPNAYPLNQLDALTDIPTARICIKGMGLTAIDLLLYLTEGQGGHFLRDGSGKLEYFPSGREPEYLTAISPSGQLITARPRNDKAATNTPAHTGVFLNFQTVDRLRERRGKFRVLPNGMSRSQLDFERDVLPLIILEMCYVFYATGQDSKACSDLRNAMDQQYNDFFDQPTRAGADLDDFIKPLHATAGQQGMKRHFDWRAAFFPELNGPDYHAEVLDRAEADLRRARRGNLRDPDKCAADAVWRDLRRVHNHILDFAGLTAKSESVFQRKYLRVYHRTSNGSCQEAMEKIIALGRARVVDFSHGPAAQIVFDGRQESYFIQAENGDCLNLDMVVSGFLRRFDPATDLSPLYTNMIDRGLLQSWINVDHDAEFVSGAIAITPEHHAITREGEIETGLTLIGTPIDGVKYFQQSAARPNASNDILSQLTQWAITLSKYYAKTSTIS